MKFINQFANQGKFNLGDLVVMQRGNKYFNVAAEDLLSAGIIADTYANVLSALNNALLSINATYFLTDKNVFLDAVRINSIALDGRFLARNGDYNGAGVYTGITTGNGFTVNTTSVNLGVWTSALTPAIGDIVIYNNLHWLNLLGAVGTAPDGDAVNWEAVPNVISGTVSLADIATYGYVFEVDEINYFIVDDEITSRRDQRGNLVQFDSENSLQNPIDLFQWGNDDVYGNFVSRNATLSCRNNLFEIQYNNIQDSTITANMATNDFSKNSLYNVGSVDYSASLLDVTDLGITSIYSGGMVHVQGNAVNTVIDLVNTPVKVAGVTTLVEDVGFDNDGGESNRLNYIGKTPIKVKVNATISAIRIGGGTPTFNWYIAKNGVVAVRSCIARDMTNANVSLSIVDILDLIQDDFLELWTENATNGNDVLIQDFILTVHRA